mmetsp:Transcript_12499/g.48713  ORF Transcript_12499/g.48713 Transcript_12499/m.48713 type:complete len:249 (+) Transcript_12499:1824-2570(+)
MERTPGRLPGPSHRRRRHVRKRRRRRRRDALVTGHVGDSAAATGGDDAVGRQVAGAASPLVRRVASRGPVRCRRGGAAGQVRAAQAAEGGGGVEPAQGPGADTRVAPPVAALARRLHGVALGAHPTQAHQRARRVAPVRPIRARAALPVAYGVRREGLGRPPRSIHPAQAPVRPRRGENRRRRPRIAGFRTPRLGARVGRVRSRGSHDATPGTGLLPQVPRRASRLPKRAGGGPGGGDAVVPRVEGRV